MQRTGLDVDFFAIVMDPYQNRVYKGLHAGNTAQLSVEANAQKRLAEVEKAKKIISPGPSYDENLNYL